MISSLLHLVGLRPRVYYTLTNFRGGGGQGPLAPPPQYANGTCFHCQWSSELDIFPCNSVPIHLLQSCMLYITHQFNDLPWCLLCNIYICFFLFYISSYLFCSLSFFNPFCTYFHLVLFCEELCMSCYV